MRRKVFTGIVLALYVINGSYVLERFDNESDFIKIFSDIDLVKVWFDCPECLTMYLVSKYIGDIKVVIDTSNRAILDTKSDEVYVVGRIDYLVRLLKEKII